jgi:hypothetical protein
MMPISFDIKYRPNGEYEIFMRWLGKPELEMHISSYDLDILIERATYLRMQLGG